MYMYMYMYIFYHMNVWKGNFYTCKLNAYMYMYCDLLYYCLLAVA